MCVLNILFNNAVNYEVCRALVVDEYALNVGYWWNNAES